ncbi:MAG: NnrU family protein [Rhodobacter sp.]|nr:NnrU family protein [Rhodobacter sp.]MCY4168203.1 NnrU family protein [Rhodobacter sp.]MCY4242370.1 NnrU family protein [Rhodobacter sp.]
MTWQFILYLGIALWCLAHLFKRLDPTRRKAMEERMGKAARGIVAFAIVISVALMVIGYRGADAITLYDPPAWTWHANNLMMAIAVALFGLSGSRSRARGWIRHPMLTGFLLWAIAHLLVNGDSASVVMFGCLGAWAIAEMLMINRAEPVWERFEGGTPAGDIRLLAIAAVAFAIIAAIHVWIGPSPFRT